MIHNRRAALGRLTLSRYTSRPGSNFGIGIMDTSEITSLIEAGFDAATVKVVGDDNSHFEVLVVACEFEGKRPLARHQLVYKTLGALVGNEIHALSIRALTPDEWQQQSG